MRVPANALVRGINDFIRDWQKVGLVVDSRNHAIYRRANGTIEITWGDDGYVLKDDQFASLSEYINLVENRQYSLLLAGGDMLQISFSLRRDEVVKHRLCWYPCPVVIDQESIETLGLVEAVLEKMAAGEFEDFHSKSPLRFDFDPGATNEEHPEVHLHLSSEECRIPVKTPLCLRKFLDFVAKNFYPIADELFDINEQVITWDGRDTLTDGQKSRFHLNLFPAVADNVNP